MSRHMDKLMKGIAWFIAFLLFLAVLTVAAQVLWRYVFRKPISWTDQLCRFLYVWIVMLGIPVIFHYKSVTMFDSLSKKLGEKGQTRLHIAVCLLAIFFAVAYFIFSWQFVMKKGWQTIPGFGELPYWTIYVAQPICCVLLFFEMLTQLMEDVKALRRREGAGV